MKNLLIVGNEFSPEAGLLQLLNGSGYTVISESNGHSMMSLLSAGMPIDLVIMDYQVSDMDGNNFLQYIRQVAPHVPVIALSAHISIEKYLHAMSLGAYEYVNKPVDDHEIIRIVNAATRSLPQRNLAAEAA